MNYDKTKYKVWTWKNPMVLHWIINPGLAFNELALGQRIPKVMLVERNSPKSLNEKSWVPCPHCGLLHEGLKWSNQNGTAFKNWFGYYCDNCGKIIPCLTNLTTYIILGLTFPVWFWFKDKWEAKWLEEQKTKFSKPLNLVYLEPSKFQLLRAGLYFGLTMYLLMQVLFPLIIGETPTKKGLLTGIPIWAVAGFLFGFTLKIISSGKRNTGLRKAESLLINSVGQRPAEKENTYKTTSPERA